MLFFQKKFKCRRIHFQVKSMAAGRISSSWAVGLRTSALCGLLAGGLSQLIATGDPLYLVHMWQLLHHGKQASKTIQGGRSQTALCPSHRHCVPAFLPHSIHQKQAIRSSQAHSEGVTEGHEYHWVGISGVISEAACHPLPDPGWAGVQAGLWLFSHPGETKLTSDPWGPRPLKPSPSAGGSSALLHRFRRVVSASCII